MFYLVVGDELLAPVKICCGSVCRQPPSCRRRQCCPGHLGKLGRHNQTQFQIKKNRQKKSASLGLCSLSFRRIRAATTAPRGTLAQYSQSSATRTSVSGRFAPKCAKQWLCCPSSCWLCRIHFFNKDSPPHPCVHMRDWGERLSCSCIRARLLAVPSSGNHSSQLVHQTTCAALASSQPKTAATEGGNIGAFENVNSNSKTNQDPDQADTTRTRHCLAPCPQPFGRPLTWPRAWRKAWRKVSRLARLASVPGLCSKICSICGWSYWRYLREWRGRR